MAAIVEDICRMTSPGTADGQGRGMAISTGMSGLDSSGKGDGPFHNARDFETECPRHRCKAKRPHEVGILLAGLDARMLVARARFELTTFGL